MKLVFTADIHLDSVFADEDSKVRNAELLQVFSDIVGYATDIRAGAVLLGGDLFDLPYPSVETVSAVKSIIKNSAPLMFYAVCGNHDPLYKTAFYKDVPDNMLVFGEDISKVVLDDVELYGVSVKTANDDKDPFEGFHANGKFITLSHGDLSGSPPVPLSQNTLADSGASLNLLGHIHKRCEYILSSGKRAVYCGCPAGRGFDECGEKGFYVIDTDSFDCTFVKTSAKIYTEYNIDISDCTDTEQLMELLQNVTVGQNEIARAVLSGNVKKPLNTDFEALLSYLPQFVEIKDKSVPDIDVLKSIGDNTLEGEFVRILVKKLEGSKSEQEKQILLDAIKEGVLALTQSNS